MFHVKDDRRPRDDLVRLEILDDLAYIRVYCHTLTVIACWLCAKTDLMGIYKDTFEPIFV